jgi:hypothetical protein
MFHSFVGWVFNILRFVKVNQYPAIFIHIEWLVHADMLCLDTSLLCFTAFTWVFSIFHTVTVNRNASMYIHIEGCCLL